jgi:hypothetical protein
LQSLGEAELLDAMSARFNAPVDLIEASPIPSDIKDSLIKTLEEVAKRIQSLKGRPAHDNARPRDIAPLTA